MMKKQHDTTGIEHRIREIETQLKNTGDILFGSLNLKKQRYVKAGGEVVYHKGTHMFQYQAGHKKQAWKRIPDAAVERVREMIDNGNRVKALAREYEALVNQANLAGLKKTAAAATRPPGQRPRRAQGV